MSNSPRIHTREVPPRTVFALEQAGVHPLLARLFAARGVRSAAELDDTMAQLLPPSTLRGSAEAARLLADAIDGNKRIVVVDDRLRAPLLADDWSAWAEAWHALDAGPLRELVDASGEARLSLCGERLARSWQPAQRPWWKNLLGARGPSMHAVLEAL